MEQASYVGEMPEKDLAQWEPTEEQGTITLH